MRIAPSRFAAQKRDSLSTAPERLAPRKSAPRKSDETIDAPTRRALRRFAAMKSLAGPITLEKSAPSALAQRKLEATKREPTKLQFRRSQCEKSVPLRVQSINLRPERSVPIRHSAPIITWFRNVPPPKVRIWRCRSSADENRGSSMESLERFALQSRGVGWLGMTPPPLQQGTRILECASQKRNRYMRRFGGHGQR